MQLENGKISLSVVVDNKPVSIRIIPATKKRCNVAFVSGLGTEALFKKLNSNGNDLLGHREPVKGLYFDPKLVASTAHDSLGDLAIPSFRESIGLPDNCIVIRDCSKNMSRTKRLKWGSTIRHEFAHSNGEGEYGAHKAQDQYLMRNYLLPRFLEDESLFSFLGNHPQYGKREEQEARIEAVNYRIKEIARRLKVRA